MAQGHSKYSLRHLLNQLLELLQKCRAGIRALFFNTGLVGCLYGNGNYTIVYSQPALKNGEATSDVLRFLTEKLETLFNNIIISSIKVQVSTVSVFYLIVTLHNYSIQNYRDL